MFLNIHRQRPNEYGIHLQLLKNCQHLKPNEVVIAAQASAIVKYDLSNCKILREPVLKTSVVLYFRKHHFLLPAVNRKISLFKSAGLIDFWISSFEQTNSKNTKLVSGGPTVLTFHKMSGIFKAWFYGLLITTVTFIFEILIKPLSRFVKQTRNRMNGNFGHREEE